MPEQLQHSYIQVEGELFEHVQANKIFRDSKTFVDSLGKDENAEIIERFHKWRSSGDDDLDAFVERNFNIPHDDDPEAFVPEAVTMENYIKELWKHLSRPAHEKVSERSTLIPLEYPYIVPGGRFREVYYWDSYFTMEGLAACGELDIVNGMVNNISDLIAKLGFMPNGNRVYYLTRSHPPFFVTMLELIEREEGAGSLKQFVPQLETEYRFWMNGQDDLGDEESFRRAVNTSGHLLNRYYDEAAIPRPEAYWEDMEVASEYDDEKMRQKVFRSLRAGSESGWDFSSRWLEDPYKLHTIRTIDILPVDLNSIIHRIESKLAEWTDKTDFYSERARKRKEAIDQIFWNQDEGFYFDYNYVKGRQKEVWSLAATAPLFFGISSQEQADLVAEHIEKKFLVDGGLTTTLNHTGEQWDRPNGWAPLHWIAINGLLNYGHMELAQDIAERWIFTNRKMFKETGQMKEKYNVEHPKAAAEDGEYIVQNGFGWTNGVAIALMKNYLFDGNSGMLNTEPLKER